LICKDPSRSDSASISLVLREPVLSFRSLLLHVFRPSTDNAVSFVRRFVLLHLSCKVSSSTLYQM